MQLNIFDLIESQEIIPSNSNDLDFLSRINHLRRLVLIHSCIYYRLNTSIVSDLQFDKWSNELVKLQSDHPLLSKKGIFHDDFRIFDGTTGYDLSLNNKWVENTAMYILNLYKNI